MRKVIFRILALGIGSVLGTLVILLIGAIIYLQNRPDLQPWQTADLDEEFREGQGIDTFEEYLLLEDRLFKQLKALVYDVAAKDGTTGVCRYVEGSLADPSRWDRNWNRTFEFEIEEPACGVLLLHGLTDAPYSMRAIAEKLSRSDAYVLGLRIPGHGTAPSALTDITWQDMAAAVKIAVEHVHQKVGRKPVYVIGYSNGGALAVQYALESIRDDSLPKVDRIALLSPEIGVTPAAALAVWQGRIGQLLGLEKLDWNAILPEYDPFKYNSFPVNAGDQVYRLTKYLRRGITALESEGQADRFPPVLAFQSAVDATVSTPALIEVLFDHLAARRENELVLFDLNRLKIVVPFLTHDPKLELRHLLDVPDRRYNLTIITNREHTVSDIVAKKWPEASEEGIIEDIPETWPRNVYSLSHIALPFRKDDPVYGDNDPPTSPGVALGNLAFRGERGVLVVSPSDQLRLHWNPFYDYVELRILEFFGLKEGIIPNTLEPREY